MVMITLPAVSIATSVACSFAVDVPAWNDHMYAPFVVNFATKASVSESATTACPGRRGSAR